MSDMSVAEELGPCTSAVATEETKKPFTSKPFKKGFSEILVHYLERCAKETREVEQKVNALLTVATLSISLYLYYITRCKLVFSYFKLNKLHVLFTAAGFPDLNCST